MRAGVSLWRRAVGTVLIVVLPALALWSRLPRERLLLQRAARAADATDFDGWASDHEILRFHAPWPVDASHQPVLTRFDLKTGTRRSFIVTHYSTGSHAAMEPSPDGRWALCWDTTRVEDKVTAVNLQTGRCVQWPCDGDVYHYPLLWMPDSRRWLSVATLPGGCLMLYDIDKPGKPLRLPFPGSSQVIFQDYVAADANRFFAIDRGGRETDFIPNGVDITEYRLTAKVERLRSFRTRLPVRGEIRDTEISPTGERVAWVFEDTHQPPLAVLLRERPKWSERFEDTHQPPLAIWIHRFLHFLPVKPQDRYSLYVSDLAGRHLREIGHIDIRENEEEPSLDIQWLPDGTRLSFVYKNALYTVPADERD